MANLFRLLFAKFGRTRLFTRVFWRRQRRLGFFRVGSTNLNDSTFGLFFKLKYAKTYEAVMVTPKMERVETMFTPGAVMSGCSSWRRSGAPARRTRWRRPRSPRALAVIVG